MGTTSPLAQVQGVDYTVSGAGSDSGGSVTMTVAPGSGDILTISRTTPMIQETELPTNGPFVPVALSNMSDWAALALQDQVRILNTEIAVVAAEVEDPAPAQTITVNAQRGNLVLNGGFELAQRLGAGFLKTPSGGTSLYLCDRWLSGSSQAMVFSHVVPTVNGFGTQPQYGRALHLNVNGHTNTKAFVWQEIDRDFLTLNRGQVFTLSAWLLASSPLATAKAFVICSDAVTGRMTDPAGANTDPAGYSSGSSNFAIAGRP